MFDFLTEDTYPGEEEYPLTINRYTYGLNNPVNHKDPSGHMVPLPSASGGRTSGAGTSRGAAVKGGSAALTKGLSILQRYSEAKTAQQVNIRYRNAQKEAKKMASYTGTRSQTTIAKRTAEVKARVIRKLCNTATRIIASNVANTIGATIRASGVNLSFIAIPGIAVFLEALPAILQGIGETLFVIGAVIQAVELAEKREEDRERTKGEDKIDDSTRNKSDKDKDGSLSKPSTKPYKNNKKANEQAQKHGYDNAHDLKESYVGKKNIAKLDMKYDTRTGEIYLESKDGKIQIPTGLYHKQ